MIQQTEFEVETGLPRWGCMFMSLVYAGYMGSEGREPTLNDILTVYNDCRVGMTPKWVGGVQVGEVPILEMITPSTYEITVNNPSMVIEKALSYVGAGWRGGQSPDRDLMVPGSYPRDYRLTYTLLNYRRKSNDGHWVLGDRSGMNIVYNPDESLDIDWWSRSPKWRGIRIYHV